MVNRKGVPIAFDPGPSLAAQAPAGTALPAVARDWGRDGLALETMADKLTAHLGAWGDEQAKIEGKRAGAISGADLAFRPTDSATVRGGTGRPDSEAA